LMFWTGTYETGRDIPVSHVMLYLGREKGSGKRIMFGASDGRSWLGESTPDAHSTRHSIEVLKRSQ